MAAASGFWAAMIPTQTSRINTTKAIITIPVRAVIIMAADLMAVAVVADTGISSKKATFRAASRAPLRESVFNPAQGSKISRAK